MKIRGAYSISVLDKPLSEDKLRSKAQGEIVNQLIDSFVKNFGDKIVREEASQKYPYGRYYLDVNVDVDPL